MKYLAKRSICLAISLVIIFSLNMSFAQVDSFNRRAELETMIDEFMKESMEKYHVPGVTLSIVKDGKLYFKKGYGYSDLEDKTPVNPDDTLFRIGSVSKLFTATAAMQLYEKGKLSLDDQVNKYLEDFKVEYFNKKPITIHHLLTHTAGFDERIINILSNDIGEELPQLDEFLKENIPSTIREPGEIMQYSNHGITMLGYIVEAASGKGIDQYIKERIFEKLDMKNSSYYFTEDLIRKTSKGYSFSNNMNVELDPIRVITHPAGSILSTSEDMSKFLIAHLEGDKLLREETLKSMQRTQFTHYDKMLGNTYGFYEVMRANNKVIEHGGNTPAFASLLSLHPESKLGFFISCNSNEGGTLLREEFANRFYDHLLGKASPRKNILELEEKKINIEDYVGKYTVTTITKKTPLKLLRLLLGHVEVKKIDDSNISVEQKGEEVIYSKIQKNLFIDNIENSYLVFQRDSKNRLYMIKEREPFMGLLTGMYGSYEKVNEFSLAIEASIFTTLSVQLAYLLIILISFIRKKKKRYVGGEFIAERLMMITSFMILVLSGVFIWMIAKVISLNMDFSTVLVTIHILSYALLGLTITTTFFTIKTWKEKYWSVKGRIWHTIVNLSSITMIMFISYMNCFNILY